MIYFICAADEYLKKHRIQQLSESLKVDLVWFKANQDLPEQYYPGNQSLFSGPELPIFDNIWFNSSLVDSTEQWLSSKQPLVIVEKNLDKRKKNMVALAENSQVNFEIIKTPEGQDLSRFISDYIANLNGSIQSAAIDNLLELIKPTSVVYGHDTSIDMFRLVNELDKLATYAAGQVINSEMVDKLVVNTFETEVWAVLNAISERNKQKALQKLDCFFYFTDKSGEKTLAIQINSLLADQIRNLLVIKSMVDRQYSEQNIALETGWKPGRIAVLKKLSNKFEKSKLMDILAKLAKLDQELKSTNVVVKPVWSLIISQI